MLYSGMFGEEDSLSSLLGISPISNIYFSSGYAVLVWLLPYACGIMTWHFKVKRWGKGVGWLLLMLLTPSIILAQIFALGLENDLYTPRTTLLAVSCVVLTGEAVLWWILWFDYRKRGQLGPWRTIAFGAFVASVVLALLSVGSFFGENRYNYFEGTRVRQLAEADARHMEDVGYVPYPDAEYRFGERAIREEYEDEVIAGYSADQPGRYSEALSIDFRTADDPMRVVEFYAERAQLAGVTARMGSSRRSGSPVMVGVGSNGTAIVVELLQVGNESPVSDWAATIYWDTPAGFGERLYLGFELYGM